MPLPKKPNTPTNGSNANKNPADVKPDTRVDAEAAQQLKDMADEVWDIQLEETRRMLTLALPPITEDLSIQEQIKLTRQQYAFDVARRQKLSMLYMLAKAKKAPAVPKGKTSVEENKGIKDLMDQTRKMLGMEDLQRETLTESFARDKAHRQKIRDLKAQLPNEEE
jgi:hypothetical protein